MTVGPFTRRDDRPACTSCHVRVGWVDDAGRCATCRPGWHEAAAAPAALTACPTCGMPMHYARATCGTCELLGRRYG